MFYNILQELLADLPHNSQPEVEGQYTWLDGSYYEGQFQVLHCSQFFRRFLNCLKTF